MLFGSSTGGIPGSEFVDEDDAAPDGGRLVEGVNDVLGATVDGELVDATADDGPVGDGESLATGWLDVQPASRPTIPSKLTAAVLARAFITCRLSSDVLTVRLSPHEVMARSP
jgi:hypothetical protein